MSHGDLVERDAGRRRRVEAVEDLLREWRVREADWGQLYLEFKSATPPDVLLVEDLAVMFPMLEMSGTARARHIPDILMLYNRANPACVANTRRDEMERISEYLRNKPRYRQL